MMNTDILDAFNEAICQIYQTENLVSLEDNNYKYKDITTLAFPSSSIQNEPRFNPVYNVNDAITCSKDLKYFTGLLFLYRPHINNPFSEVAYHNSKPVYTYFQNQYDRRYCMFVTCCYEKCYNFWDRIGDAIFSFYPDLMNIRQVGFANIIDKLKLENIENDHYKWLVEFKENEYKTLNSSRRDYVHYYQYETVYRYEKHSENNMDGTSLEYVWEEKLNLPVYFKHHLELAQEGYYHAFKFLEEINLNRNLSD